MRHLTLVAMLCAAFLCFPQPTIAQSPLSLDTVVAEVDGQSVQLGHVIVLLNRLPAQYDDVADDVLFDAIVDQLVQQLALAAGVDLPAQARFVLDNEERALRALAAQTAAREEAVTEEALQLAYELAFANTPTGTEYNAAHILVETEEEASAIVTDLAEGTDFAELARNRSIGPSGPGGGDLGWFSPGMMVPDFEAAVTALAVGEVSAPVQTEFGWHVIKLIDKREAEWPRLDEVRNVLIEDLQGAAVDRLVEERQSAASITRLTADDIDLNVLRNPSLLAPSQD